MKIKRLTHFIVLAFLCLGFSLKAQTNINISTGDGQIGSADPNWTVKAPNSTNFTSVYNANALSVYATSNASANGITCGNWISPDLRPNYFPDQSLRGNWTFKREFGATVCPNRITTLDIPFISCDNQLVSISINGVSLAGIPSVSYTTGQSISQNISNLIVTGTNVIEVVVNNTSLSPLGLEICGQIKLQGGCNSCYSSIPTNLSCFGTNLNWDDVPNAVAYQVEVIYNDPRCCPGASDPYMAYLPSTVFGGRVNGATLVSEYTMNSINGCMTWRVRALCRDTPMDETSWGPWSTSVCGCGLRKGR